MENTKSAPTDQKTPDELASQLDIINLERHLSEQQPLPTTAVMPEDPLHQEYVGSLRQLRKDQTQFLKSKEYALRASEEGQEYGEFWRSREFSPLGWIALSEVNGTYYDENDLSVSQRQAGTQSVEMLTSMTDRLIEKTDSVLFRKLPTLEKIYGKDQALQRIEQSIDANPQNSLWYVDTLVEQMDDADAKRLIQKAVDAIIITERAPGNISVLLDPKLRETLRPDQLEPLAKLSLTDSNSFCLGRNFETGEQTSKVLELQKAGFVDEKQITDSILKILGAKELIMDWGVDASFSSSLDAYKAMLESAGVTDQAKEFLLKRVNSGELAGEIASIALFTRAEKQDICRTLIDKKPDTFLASRLRDTIDLIGPEETKAVMFRDVAKLDGNTVQWAVDHAPEGFLSAAELENLVGEFIKHDPTSLFTMTKTTIKVFGNEVAQKMIRDAYSAGALDEPKYGTFSNISDWLPLLSDDPGKLKDIFAEQFGKTKDISALFEWHGGKFQLEDMFSKEEIISLAESKLFPEDMVTESWAAHYLKDGVDSLINRFGIDQVKSWANRAIDDYPDTAAILLDGSMHLLSKADVTEMTKRIIATNPAALLDRPVLVMQSLGKEGVSTLIDSVIALNPREAVGHVKSMYGRGFINKTDYKQYGDALIKINPAFVCQSGAFGVNGSNIIEIMREQTDLEVIAPKWFKQFAYEYPKAKSTSQTVLMDEAELIYDSLYAISQHSPELLDSVKEIGANPKSQFNTITKLAFLVKSGVIEQGATPEIVGTENNLNDLVYIGLNSMLGVELTDAAKKNLDGSLETMITYLVGIKRSPEHNKLVSDLITCGSAEDFKNFRLIADSEQALSEAKKQGLLPAGLTAEQHAAWRNEIVLHNNESLRSSGDEVLESVRRILSENEEYFDLGSSLGLSPEEKSMIGPEIGKLGSKLADLQRLLGSKDLADEDREAATELAESVADELSQRQSFAQLSTLFSLTTDEVISGGTVDKDGKKTNSIKNIIDRSLKLASKRGLAQEAELAIKQVAQIFDSYDEETDDIRAISATDTIDLKTTMEIGANPVRSCQHYANGAYRTALLGYTDPNTKIIVMRDGESIIARSVLRLLEDESGQPSLFIESVYTQNPSKLVTETIEELAFEKSKAMGGVPVFMSASKAKANKAQTDAKYGRQPVETTLKARALRAPIVYVDAKGGPQRAGYTLSELAQLIEQ